MEDDATMEWERIDTAPFDHDVEIAVIDGKGEHALVFPCRRIIGGWANAQTRKQLHYILPTHWRDWSRLTEAQDLPVAISRPQ